MIYISNTKRSLSKKKKRKKKRPRDTSLTRVESRGNDKNHGEVGGGEADIQNRGRKIAENSIYRHRRKRLGDGLIIVDD